MKEQYFADQRDYVKYSILRHLLGQELTCTVCWMMTPYDGTRQGAHRGYLRRPIMRGFDPDVFAYLLDQVGGGAPDIHSVEHDDSPISACRFYWDRFPLARNHRHAYFGGCLEVAEGVDLVFCDPDIGPEPQRLPNNDMDKYIQWDEIVRIFDAGHSVIVFNYLRGGTRQKDRLVAMRSEHLQHILPDAVVTALRTHDLAFYFGARVEHSDAVGHTAAAIVEAWDGRVLWQAHNHAPGNMQN